MRKYKLGDKFTMKLAKISYEKWPLNLKCSTVKKVPNSLGGVQYAAFVTIFTQDFMENCCQAFGQKFYQQCSEVIGIAYDLSEKEIVEYLRECSESPYDIEVIQKEVCDKITAVINKICYENDDFVQMMQHFYINLAMNVSVVSCKEMLPKKRNKNSKFFNVCLSTGYENVYWIAAYN